MPPTSTAEIRVPARMARRPRDRHQRLVPWFVGYVDGQPDHRVVRPDGLRDAVRLNLCWLCGETRGAYQSFVISPMCAVNRVAGEPPSHRDCANYSVLACPFLATPSMRRRPNLPENTVPPDGEMNPRNPGVSLVWTTRSWVRKPGFRLFDIGDPTSVTWWREGQPATYSQALDALVSSMEILGEKAAEDRHPERAAESLEEQYWKATNYLPGNFRNAA